METKLIVLNGESLCLYQAMYGNRRIALFAKTLSDEPYCKLTVNLPEVIMGPNQAAIPIWEYGGDKFEAALKQVGVISGEPLFYAESGWVQNIPIYEFNLDGIAHGSF